VDSRGVFVDTSNQGRIWIGGYDINASYRLPLKSLGLSPALGTLDFSFNFNKVLDNDFQASAVSVRRDCIGFYSNACGAPNWGQRFTQATTWSFNDVDVGYSWRRVSAIKVEPGSGTWFEPYTAVPAYNYVDLSAAWSITKNLRLSLAVNNAFNKAPPKVGNTIATTATNGGETLPSSYDTVGRFYSFAAKLSF